MFQALKNIVDGNEGSEGEISLSPAMVDFIRDSGGTIKPVKDGSVKYSAKSVKKAYDQIANRSRQSRSTNTEQ